MLTYYIRHSGEREILYPLRKFRDPATRDLPITSRTLDHEVDNKSLIAWVSVQYSEILHESAEVFPLIFGSGKYFCTLVQYLAILVILAIIFTRLLQYYGSI